MTIMLLLCGQALLMGVLKSSNCVHVCGLLWTLPISWAIVYWLRIVYTLLMWSGFPSCIYKHKRCQFENSKNDPHDGYIAHNYNFSGPTATEALNNNWSGQKEARAQLENFAGSHSFQGTSLQQGNYSPAGCCNAVCPSLPVQISCLTIINNNYYYMVADFWSGLDPTGSPGPAFAFAITDITGRTKLYQL